MARGAALRSVADMNATDYLINAALVLLVLRQIRETRLSWQILVLPVLIVLGAAAYYLRSVPLAGNPTGVSSATIILTIRPRT